MKRILNLFMLLAVSYGAMRAETTAGIRGTVSDAAERPIAGAQITLTNTGTGLMQNVTTSSAGAYLFTLLPPGSYRMRISAAGFEEIQRDDIVLTTSEVLGLNFAMTVGAVNATVEVSGQVSGVNTQTPDVSTLVSQQQIKALPLNGRNAIQLATLTNGVSASSVPTVIQGLDSRSMSHLSVNGNQEFMTEYDLDGGVFQDPETNSGINFPNPDALREIKFITSNYSAEYGQSAGGVFSAVTNSGTNQLHGSLWEFNRNSALAARNYFLSTVAPLNQNQFGFTMGGPVVKNKLFAFGTIQWLRLRQGLAVSSAFPPTAAERLGDFSASSTPVIDPQTNAQFPDNQIPASRVDPVVAKYLNLIPLPNSPDGSFRGAFAQPSNNYQWMVKPDYQLTSRQRLSGSVFIDRTASSSLINFGRFNVPLLNTTGNPAEFNTFHASSVIVDHTYTIRPNLLNYARFSYLKGLLSFYANRGPTLIQLGATYPTFPLTDVPEIDAAGRYNVDAGNITNTSWSRYSFSDSLTLVLGPHSLKFGGSYLQTTFDEQSSANSAGYFNGTGSVTGNPLADMMLGMTQSYVSNIFSLNTKQRTFAGYAQDDYKVSRNVVLNLGLRYQNASMFRPEASSDFQTPTGGKLTGGVSFIQGQQSEVFRNAPAGLVYSPQPGFGGVGDKGVPSSLVFTPTLDFSPRVGVSWDVRGDGKTAVRAGYGLFYDTWHENSVYGALEGPPFFVNFYQPVTPNLTNPVASLAGQFPVQLTQDLEFTPFEPVSTETVDPHLKTPFVQQYNFTLQHEFPGGVTLQGAYVGSIGRRLMYINNINSSTYIPGVGPDGQPLSTLGNEASRAVLNQPFLPSTPFGQMGHDLSNANSSYNSLQVQAVSNARHGLTFLAAYTWSKSLDLTSFLITTGNYSGFAQNPNDIKAEHGPSDYNKTNVFTGSVDYLTPSVSKAIGSDNWFVRQTLDAWEVSSIVSLTSGFPFTVTTGTDNSLTGANNDRPNLVGIPTLSTSRSNPVKILEYFNTAAFQANPVGTFGDVHRNSLVGPGLENVDLGVFKNIPTERIQTQIRFEFFNAFNRTNFSNPVASLSSGPSFGRITSTAGPSRVIQVGAKITF
jgi:hypothetical protein